MGFRNLTPYEDMGQSDGGMTPCPALGKERHPLWYLKAKVIPPLRSIISNYEGHSLRL